MKSYPPHLRLLQLVFAMIFKPLLLALATVALTGCASVKGPSETNTHNLDGSQKSSEEMRLYELKGATTATDTTHKFLTNWYNVPYAVAFEQTKEQAATHALTGASLNTVAGLGNMGVAVLDRASGLLGGSSLFSSTFAGGLFLVGWLAGSNDRAVADDRKYGYAKLMSPTTLYITRLHPSDSTQNLVARHQDIEQSFIDATKLAETIGCSYSPPDRMGSVVNTGVVHVRYYPCQSNSGKLQIRGAVSDWASPNTVVSSISLFDIQGTSTEYFAKIKDKIPTGYVAIFSGKVKGETKVLVASKDLVTAFDPPPAP